jgi:IclR family acetate operon transcriptional repressor
MHLGEIRASGFALDAGENEVGGQCIAAALPFGGIQLAISISGPAARLTPDTVPTAAKRLRETAAALTEELEGIAAAGQDGPYQQQPRENST